MGETGHFKGCKAGAIAAAAGSLARAISLLVQNVGDVGIDVIIEKLVYQIDNAGLRLNLLGRQFWAHGGERLDLAALEADAKLGGSSCRAL